MSTQNKRSSMTLYVNNNNLFCQKIKMVLTEKDIIINAINVQKQNKLKELYELNPYGKVPTLMTKDLVVYETDIIFEYLEERFPYPPLLSVFPLERAQARMLSKRIDQKWIPLLTSILNSKNKEKKNTNKLKLLQLLLNLIPILNKQPYLLGKDFTIVDCSLATILYNLSKINIRLPKQAIPLIEYAERLFIRKSFKKSIKN